MTQTRSARAPAKINLGLRIVGRRADGYHELESLFVPLDLSDDLKLRISPASAPKGTLRTAGGAFEAPETGNLAARAAEAFLAEARLEIRVEIELAKHVPLAAGLGEGSSDAGAVLRALSGYAPDALSPARLAAIALSLGADVPFFLDPRPAWVRGIGERIEACAPVPSLAVGLVNPGVALPTAEVFRAFDALGPGAPPPPAPELDSAFTSPQRLRALLHNDLEAAALRLRPELRRLRERLEGLGPAAVGMSGSGPTLFGVFESPEIASAALARGGFEPPVWVWVARTGEAG